MDEKTNLTKTLKKPQTFLVKSIEFNCSLWYYINI